MCRQHSGLQARRRDELEAPHALQTLKQGRPVAGEDQGHVESEGHEPHGAHSDERPSRRWEISFALGATRPTVVARARASSTVPTTERDAMRNAAQRPATRAGYDASLATEARRAVADRRGGERKIPGQARASIGQRAVHFAPRVFRGDRGCERGARRFTRTKRQKDCGAGVGRGGGFRSGWSRRYGGHRSGGRWSRELGPRR